MFSFTIDGQFSEEHLITFLVIFVAPHSQFVYCIDFFKKNGLDLSKYDGLIVLEILIDKLRSTQHYFMPIVFTNAKREHILPFAWN